MTEPLPEPEDVLDEQVDYYRARAGEYDRWYLRRGRYDHGPEARQRWFAELDEVRLSLAELPLDGAEVLELAAGTGIWTETLTARARHVTAVDASTEMVAENRRRLGTAADRVTFVLADLFVWQPDRRWDAVVFCFWISHVPEARLDGFLRKVARSVRPGGSVFFLDGRREPTSAAADHVLPEEGHETMVRQLDDGRRFRIVKNYRSSRALEERCHAAGLAVEVRETSTYFQVGRGISGALAPGT